MKKKPYEWGYDFKKQYSYPRKNENYSKKESYPREDTQNDDQNDQTHQNH